MDLEKAIIKRTTEYLFTRDLLLLALIALHILLYSGFFSYSNIAAIIAGISGCAAIAAFVRLMAVVKEAKKDDYLSNAFNDEYFANIDFRSGYRAFVSMIICSVIIFGTGIILGALKYDISIPFYFVCEIILFVGILANDMSKAAMVRG